MLRHCYGEQNGSATLELAWQVLIKLNIDLPRDPAILLIGIYPRETKAYVHTKTCIPLFFATIFIMSKNWK